MGLRCIILRFIRDSSREMSGNDESVFFSEAEDSQDVSEESDSDEMVVSGLVEPYQDEPLAHSSDEDEEDNELDEDGLSPAILRARFEGESPLTEW